VPPKNLPSIRLPFFSSKESAHAIDAARQNTRMTNPQLSLNFIKSSPLSGFGKPLTLSCQTYKISSATKLPFGDRSRTGIVKVATGYTPGKCQYVGTRP